MRLKRSVPTISAERVCALLDRAGCVPAGVGPVLGLTTSEIADVAARGGPAWVGYALVGLAVAEFGMSADAACSVIGLVDGHHDGVGYAGPRADALRRIACGRRSTGSS
jgi:hypothetical protein